MLAIDERAGDADGPLQRWQQVGMVLLVAVALPAVMVLFVIWRNPEFSVLDEAAHSDYLRRIEQGEVPRVGDKLLEATVRDVQCRTVQGRTNAPCGLPSYEPEIMGAEGYQYEAQQPPLYYVVTAGLRQVARIGPADDFVTTGRITGAAWLSAGLLVFVAACRRLGCRWWPTLVVTSLLAIGPGVLYQSATINNDAAAMLTGSLALLMFARLRERVSVGGVAIWSVASVLLVFVKPTGVVAIAAGCLALLLDGWIERRLSPKRVVAYLVPLLAGLAAYGAWGQIREARATVDYDVVLESLLSFKQIDNFPLDNVSSTITRLLGAYGSGGIPIAPTYVSEPAFVAFLALAAAAAAALWLRRGGGAAQRVGSIGLLAMLVGGPAFTVLFFWDYSIEGGPSSRYGLSLLPLVAAAAASTYRTRRAMTVLMVLGCLVFIPLVVATGWPTTRAGH
jgi:hypothetical protein